MMNFEVLQQSIIDNVLVPAEAGRFVTVGYQRQRESANVINSNRQVTVYYSEGDLPRGPGQAYGDVMHDVAFLIELAVASPAQIDISILDNEDSTANEKATALRQLSEAGMVADREMNELIRIVFQILMDNRNEQLGMVPPEDRSNLKLVSSRWVDQIRKDNPNSDGEYLMLTGSMRLVCRIEETVTGEDLPETPAGGAIFDSDIDLDGDDTEKTGVTVTTS
jgi:hypothetical protein